jgi:hypothetical protein
LRAGERLALRAGPMPARVVGDALVTAGVALFDMAAEGRGAAQLDGTHRASLHTTVWRDNPDERRATIKLRMSRQK